MNIKSFISDIRFLLIAGLFLFVINTSHSQIIGDYNKLSVELSGGLHVPFSPADGINRSDYIGVKQFQISTRYMVSHILGVKLFYAINRFDGGDYDLIEIEEGVWQNENLYSTFSRFGVEGVVDLPELMVLNSPFFENFGILAHGGIGLSYTKSSTRPGVDRMGNLIIGITPQYRLSDRFAVFGDISYIMSLKQHHKYNGLLFEDGEFVTGGFMNISLGFTFYIGGNRTHVDWY